MKNNEDDDDDGDNDDNEDIMNDEEDKDCILIWSSYIQLKLINKNKKLEESEH